MMAWRNRYASLLHWTCGIALALGTIAGAAETRRNDGSRLRLLSAKDVRLEGFWGDRARIVRDKSIPHSWQYMEHELRALRKAAGQPVQGDLNGTWGEANLFKFMETMAHALGQQRDPALEKRFDEIVALVGAAQRPNGYAHAFIVNSGKPQWDPAFLDGSHDGYVLGHMIEAAVEYYQNTGKRPFLEIACKAADEAYDHFLGPKGTPGFCGHAELEMALVELYRVTGNTKYLDLSQAFVEWRGHNKVRPAGPTPRAYFQDGAPVREQRTLDGHAVRAVFFATGVADLAIERGDVDYRLAANRFWDSATMRRMTITGSAGPRKEHEAFGEDYELPNNGYYESCVACGLADFAQRMFLLERRAECADVLERVLYNAILHGIALDGVTSYYQNPLSDKDNLRYNSWVCCPPNLSRTILQAGRYACAHGDAEVYFNLYVAGSYAFPLKAGEARLRVETDYPWDGRVRVRVESAPASPFALQLRQPGWCAKASWAVNGAAVAPARDSGGYAMIERTWKAGDTLEMNMEMPVMRIEAHPNVRDAVGKVAIQRGPIVYGIEGIDNGGKVDIELPANPTFKAERRPDLLSGVTVITGKKADGQPFTAIPFYAMANRGKSAQEIWLRQRNLKPTDSWWLGQLYRPIESARLTP